MYYAMAFILGYLVAKVNKGNKPVKVKQSKHITDQDFDRVKSMLDNVILELDDIQGGM